MAQQSEIISLVLAIALVPVVVWTYRRISLPRKPLLAVGLSAILGAYAATVFESFVAPDLLNNLEHLLYAVGGACFATLGVTVLYAHADTGDEDA
ncbi:MAG: hypothetical protein JW733_08340 [Coriobacteriia bacterium]|nr:hypothetical protein [Coriobacteriia bacterium]MBN2847334.1 hypothetical protein [Coriobacteriia bacterium]